MKWKQSVVANKKSISIGTVTRGWQRAKKASKETDHRKQLLTPGLGNKGPMLQAGGCETKAVILRHPQRVARQVSGKNNFFFQFRL